MKRAHVIAGCFLLTPIALLVAIPTLVDGFGGGFRWRDVSTRLSPDGQFELVVSKRMVFPANEWVDPAVVIRAELCDVLTRRVSATQRIVLVEESDFSTPAIRWAAGEVQVVGFDRRQSQEITLPYRP